MNRHRLPLLLSGLVVFGLVASDITPPPLPTPTVRARLAAAVLPAQEVPITLSWTYPEPVTPDITFRVYSASSLAGPWTVVTNVPNPIVTLSVPPASRFYVVRAVSAFWGIESPPSDPGQTPAAPVPPSTLTIARP